MKICPPLQRSKWQVPLEGTGKFIVDALFAVSGCDNIDIQAIFARPHSKEKAEAFAKQYNIPEIFTDFLEKARTKAGIKF